MGTSRFASPQHSQGIWLSKYAQLMYAHYRTHGDRSAYRARLWDCSRPEEEPCISRCGPETSTNTNPWKALYVLQDAHLSFSVCKKTMSPLYKTGNDIPQPLCRCESAWRRELSLLRPITTRASCFSCQLGLEHLHFVSSPTEQASREASESLAEPL